ncbi:MAG: multicomponent Na+:H+ antiporter subunit [Thermoleophilaceae bacterium]|jgi:multisubunit Na+/H+ antiporter MnhG subunit|nr:multicomponent Na+:H+ antiporter subunit [Thermoleophilaceae bacterium]
MTWRSALSVVLVCLGVGLGAIATLGVVVMRDWQDRVHYSGLSGLGTVCIAVAVLVRESFSVIGDKALVTALILLFAGPVVNHVILRSGRIRSLGDWRRNVDEEISPR